MNAITLNKKQNDVLEAAKALFWKYGLKKVSIEEICREAKTSKVTFYKFYPNKVEVAKAIIDQMVGGSIDEFTFLIENAATTAELLEGMLKMKKEGVHEISKEFLADFYADNTLGLKEYIGQKTQEVWTETLSSFRRLQERGIIRNDMNLEFFLYLSQKVSSMIEDPYLVSLFPTGEELIMEITNLFTYGMTPRNDQK
jgi:AcrR family transcriptional regulator